MDISTETRGHAGERQEDERERALHAEGTGFAKVKRGEVTPPILGTQTFPEMGSWGVMRKVICEGVRGEQILMGIGNLRVYPQGDMEPQEGLSALMALTLRPKACT